MAGGWVKQRHDGVEAAMTDATRVLGALLGGVHLARPEDLPALAMQAARLLGAEEMTMYLVDYGQASLVPLTCAGAGRRDILAVDGTLAGRAFALTEVYETGGDAARRIWVPLLDGTERLG